jgi:hypothetical protein
VAFEHAVLLLRTCILLASPSTPKWIEEARELLEARRGRHSARFRLSRRYRFYGGSLRKPGSGAAE